jgi:hypothetical protein
MSEQGFSWGNLYSLVGVRIIPSEDVPNGFRRTVGTDIFVSSRNYEYMRPLSAKGMIIVLGLLTEQHAPSDTPGLEPGLPRQHEAC